MMLSRNGNTLQIRTLAELKPGEIGKVLGIADPALKEALLRIGLIEGDSFLVSDLAPMGGPMALRLRGGKVALRLTDAAKVEVSVGNGH